MFITYINDIPKVPEELLEDPVDIVAKKPLQVLSEHGVTYINTCIQRKNISNELLLWLRSVFKFRVTAQYLMLNNASPIHKDPPLRRQAYNYIIVPGGPSVTTTVYDEDMSTVLKSEVIPEKTWHCLDTSLNHGVTGIADNTWRILLSINKP